MADLTAHLWEKSPSTAPTALQVHVHHLRRVLSDADDGHGGPRILTHRSPHAALVRYELQVAAGAVDVDRFRELKRREADARSCGDQDAARRAFAEAMALWRGEPLTDLPATAAVRQLRGALVDDMAALRLRHSTVRTGTVPPGAKALVTGESPATRTVTSSVTPGDVDGPAARTSSGELRFSVLGPVRAWRGDKPIVTGAPQQRALLAALLLRGGRTASAPELLDALWGENPPNTALAALRSYAFRLRKALGPHSLVTDSGGYALHVPPDALDYTVVERLAANAEKVKASDPEHARRLLAAALDLWHGEPLAGLPGPYAETQRSRLLEWRISLVEARLELDLELGGHADAVSELTALSAQHPLRERLRALLMLALYRSGRQAEALGVYADTRRLLADELGIDPSPDLSDLHQRILEADPDLGTPASAAAGTPETIRPAQLPATIPDFTGRRATVDELARELTLATEQGNEHGAMVVCAVAGIAGIGKTSLAVHVAHGVRDAFPDGQLYVDLQPTDPRSRTAAGTVLGAFLRALGVPHPAIPDSLAERAALYRSTLDGRRVLILLDNAHDAAQIRPLLPGTPGCATLVTSRARMVDLPGAHLVDLGVLEPGDALELFTRIVGEERVADERQAALAVVRACGFLPLAIRIAATRLLARPTWTVSVLADRLAASRQRLGELRAGDLDVKAAFALSYRYLSDRQARAFRLLSLPEGPDISLDAAAAALDLDRYAADEILEELVDIRILGSSAPGRYRFHDLLRLFARERAERDETEQDRHSVLSRLLDFHLASATAVYAHDNPDDYFLTHRTATTHPGLSFNSRHQAVEWLFAEAPSLLAAVQQAADTGQAKPARAAADLLWAAQDLLESGAHAQLYEQAARALITSAHTCGEMTAEGRTRVLLAHLLRVNGQPQEADSQAQQALAAGRSVNDSLTCGSALNIRGTIACANNRYDDGITLHTNAMTAFRADGNRRGEASALSNLSLAQRNLGRLDAAVSTGRQAVALYRELGTGFRLGNALYAVSIPLTAANYPDEAVGCLTEALHIFHSSRQRFWEGMTLYRLAQARLALGQPAQAAAHIDQALIILHDMGSEWRTANALSMLGHALAGMGHTTRARACWQDALTIYTTLGSPQATSTRELLQEQEATAPPRAVTVTGPSRR